MDRLEGVALGLPDAQRVDIAAWGDHPTFRVRGKNFVFCDQAATQLSVKLSQDEAVAVVATESWVEPASHGLGRSGWVSVRLADPAPEERWQQVAEWVRISYTLVAPKRLARLVLAAEGAAASREPE
jgi:predicted DNA-binding protein (MmcQ/YjbR family)